MDVGIINEFQKLGKIKILENSSGTPEVWRNSQITPHIWRIPQIPLRFVFGLKIPLLWTEP